jgi:hypothetical protein
MLDWYFAQTKKDVWLGTSPNTRAEIFYRKSGWIEIGTHGSGEIKFEMTFDHWTFIKKNNQYDRQAKPASNIAWINPKKK